jgi:carbonic anhydrase
MEKAVVANVRWAMQQLHDTPEVEKRIEEGVMRLVGAIYELETGRVRFLE